MAKEDRVKEQLSVRTIGPKCTYTVRHAELRKGRPMEECAFDGDKDSSTLHIGGFLGNDLIAVATMLKRDMAKHGIQNTFQLRGMAVLEDYQGKGIGKILLNFAENLAKEKEAQTLWMNARVSALGFYRNSGYKILGEVFEIPGIGPHYTMFKKF